MDLQRILVATESEVRKAGDFARRRFRHSRVVIEKPRASVATDVDLGIEKQLVEFLRREFPGQGIIAEEGGRIDVGGEYSWIIDPIDGTRYYARGVPIYSIAIALLRYDNPVLGVIYFPAFDEMFSAAQGLGTKLNSGEVRCSNTARLEDALVAVEMPARHDSTEEIEMAVRYLQKLVTHCQRVRILGLSSFAMCRVAHGGFDAYVNLGSAAKQWDLAPGRIIAEEAGSVADLYRGILLVANPVLHRDLAQLLELK